MKRLLFVMVTALLLVSCASPVLRKDLLQRGSRKPDFARMMQDPDFYKDNLYVLGGTIIRTHVTPAGSMIEALYVPVDSKGYLKDVEPREGRFFALYPKNEGFLDPMIYKKNKAVTMAAEFIGTHTTKVDKTDYAFPLFRIKQIYLWKEEEYYPYYPYYPYSTYPYYGYPYYNQPFPYSPYSPYYGPGPYWWDRSSPFWWDNPWWNYHYSQPPFWRP
ncbi:MAG: Slp family lipoprotein [Nitrospiraceae bacterium]|nr:Slp family lipoprotein [Nitrospiraceae bacterium]